MGTLYVVSTPIGNLEDLSPRAARVLREVALVAAEDTRVARKLLQRAGSAARTASYHAHSRPAALKRIMRALEDGDVALVTDAGTPAISDPGTELVAATADEGHAVVAVPGPSAVTAALAVSGMPSDRFTFVGFLPRRRADRRRELEEAATRHETTVCFETPHRLRAALDDLSDVLGDRQIAVCRELTKLHEETFRGTAREALDHFDEPRGEIAIVIAGSDQPVEQISDAEIEATLERIAARGVSGRTLVAEAAAATGATRRRVYRLALARGSS
jgi:16S rRNA (cytidine1402-2'-O)-methyltransferase